MVQSDLDALLRNFLNELAPEVGEKIGADLFMTALLRAFGRLWDALPPAKRQEVIDRASDPAGVMAIMKTSYPQEKIKAELDRARQEVLAEYIERLP